MNCTHSKYRPAIRAYVNGSISPAGEVLVLAHTTGCRECREYMRTLEHQRDQTQALLVKRYEHWYLGA